MLRKNTTEAEGKLWYELREFKKAGHYFRRQAPIGKYIVDFVCLKAKLVVEVDGEHHAIDPQLAHDIKRDDWLRAEGFKVLRFWNSEVYQQKEMVLESIFLALPLEGGGGQREAMLGGGERVKNAPEQSEGST